MRIKALLLSIVLLFSMLPLYALPVNAANETIFEDNFDSDLGNWKTVANPNPNYARINISAGVMNIEMDAVNSGQFIHIQQAPELETGDYEASFRIRLNSWTEYTFMLFRMESTSKCYGIWYNSYGYNSAVRITKNGTTKPMEGIAGKSAAAAGFKTVGWNDIKIKAEGNHIQVFINNMSVPAFDFVDENEPNLTGGLGFGSHTGQKIATGCAVDDVKITAKGNVDTSFFGGASVPDDVADTSMEEATKFLMDMYIIDGYDDEGNFKEQAAVTRGEFAKIMTSALNIPVPESVSEDVAEDVDADHEYAPAISEAIKYRLLNPDENNCIRPDDLLLYEEAVKTIIYAMGYEDVAKNDGGYPDGYIKTASRLKVLNGVESQKGYAIARGHLAQILYEAMHSDILKPIGVAPEGIIYEKDGETWLNYYFEIYSDTGVVSATSNMAIKDNDLAPDGTVCIDNYLFDIANSDIESYFGQEVDYYYYEGEEKTRYIISAVPTDDDRLTVSSRDLIDYANHTYTYYKDDRIKTAQVSDMADFFYNGRSMGTYEYYKPIDGNVELVDTDGNGEYDVVLVTSYTIVIASGYSENEKTIIDKYDKTRNIPLMKDGKKVDYKITNQKGKVMEPEAIPANSVLSTAVSADGLLVTIILNNQKVSGNVQSVKEDEIKINDTVYTKSAQIRNAENLIAGKNVELYLDYKNEIAFVELSSSNEVFVYVINKASQYDSFEDYALVRMFNTASSQIEEVKCNEKVTVDGAEYEDIDQILNNIKIASPALVRMKDGEIYSFDFPYTTTPGEKEDENSLRYIGDTYNNEWNAAHYHEMVIGRVLAVDNSTIVVNVPNELTKTKEKLFSTFPATKLAAQKVYKMEGYSTGNTITADYILSFVSGSASSYLNSMLVSEVGGVIDENGETTNYVSGYTKNGLKTYAFTTDAADEYKSVIDSIEKGVIIDIRVDSNNKIQKVSMLYDKYAEGGEVYTGSFGGGWAADPSPEFFRGTLKHFDDSSMAYVYNDSTYITKYNSAKVYIMNEGEDKITSATFKELKSTERYGEGNADTLYIEFANLKPSVIYVYRP